MSRRRRQCATCGEYSSYSAKTCANPECGKEFVLANVKPKPEAGRTDCCTPNCPRAGVICTDGRWRCGECYAVHISGGEETGDGAGYAQWRKAVDELRARKGAQ